MTRKKGLVVALSIFIGVFFILPIIGVGILKWAVLPPEKLTPLVVKKTNEFLEAHLECESVELTYFETYPYLGVKLTNGHLISHQAKDSLKQVELVIPSDSLLSFQKAIVVFNPTDYLFKGTVTIPEIILDQIRFYGYVNKDGKANWEIYESEAAAAEESSSSSLPKFNLQQIHVTNGHFVYDDRSQDLYAGIEGFFLHVDGSMQEYGNELDVETGSSSIVFNSPSYTMENEMVLCFKGHLLLAERLQGFELKDAELFVNNLPFTAQGVMAMAIDGKPASVDMNFGLQVEDMNDLLRFIPTKYFKNREQTLAKGRVVLESRVRGELGDSIVPSVNLCCKIENGAFHIKGVEQGIDTLNMDLDVALNGEFPDSSFVALKALDLVGLNTALNMRGEVRDVLGNPEVEANLKGNVDFSRLAHDFLNPDTLLLQGSMLADISTSFQMDDLLNSRFGKVKSAGNLTIDRFKVFSKPLQIDTYISGLNLFVGSEDQEDKFIQAKGLLSAHLDIDTLNVKYKDEISTNIGGLNLKANTLPVIDTAAVIPLTADMTFDHLWTKMPDSTWVVAGKTAVKAGIKSSDRNKKVPVAGASIDVDTLRYAIIPQRTGVVLHNSKFYLEALPYRQAMRQKRQRDRMNADSLVMRKKVWTQKLREKSAVTDSVTDSEESVLKNWEIRGGVKFDLMRGFSRLFPVPMHIDGTSMKFNTDKVTLNEAHVHLGNSNLVLSGEIKGMRRALLKGGKVKGDFELTSDWIDCNQLMQAMAKGAAFSEQLTSEALDAISEENVMNMEKVGKELAVETTAADSVSGLFVVPEILDLKLEMNAKRIDFKDLKLEDVKGQVIVRDQSVNLSDLSMNSNFGSGDLNMVYTAKDKTESIMGFELMVNDILVERLINLFPDIDTLVPMLRSFEGTVDCQMMAACKTDSTMSMLLPTVKASCSLSGRNMVLLDGETFTEISKTLRFKNKKRNVIDSIAVDFSIHDNEIEVFPFLVEMDRYKVAVGGTHNLDMTFDYHISVLKSPLPFKIGVDIRGNLDKYKIKIGKCKYKDFLKPAKQAELDSTRRNVREDVRNAIREQIRESAPELRNRFSEVQSQASDLVKESA